jgi:hypothetical protein
MSSILAASGEQIFLPNWGRSFWQDSVTGDMICLYASGANEVDYVTSSDSGVTWSAPSFAFPVDDFTTHNNFDTSMDRDGNVHCVHRYNGSGCYTVLGKNGSGAWAASGVVARGFFTCRSTVDARDFNGSVEVWDKSMRLFGDPATPPAARIVAVDSSDNVKAWYVSTPFTAFPTLEGTVDTTAVGASGGFPIPTDAGQFNSLMVPFSVSGDFIRYRHIPFGTWNTLGPEVDIDPSANELDLPRISGYVGDVPLTPNMGFCITRFVTPTAEFEASIHPIVASIGTSGKFEIYTTANEPNSDGFGFFRVDSTDTNHTGLGSARRLNVDNIPLKQFPNNIAGCDTLFSSGTPVAVTYYDEPYTLFFYTQGRRPNGDQTVYRIKCSLEVPESVNSSSKLQYSFSNLTDIGSGLTSWADASVLNAGAGASGLENILHWQKFKVSHSPVDAGSGVARSEIIATVGSGIVSGTGDTLTKLYMWRFDDSIVGQGDLPLPTYVTNLTAQSGDSFVGIDTVTGITNPGNLFDQDTATSGVVSSGDSITLEFDKVFSFNRIEFAWNSPPAGFLGVDISSSYDNVTFTNVHSIPTGIPGASPSLVKSSSEWDIPEDSTINVDMDGFTGKYVKMDFTGDATSRDVREIRLYGAHTTAGYPSTSAFDYEFLASKTIFREETFETTTQGSLPSGWSTYGDFSWFVDKGTHASGAFAGQPIGSGTDSAVRVDRSSPTNSSGVLEIDVDVELSRTISLDLKWDFQADVGVVDENQSTDDYLNLYVVTPTGTIDLSSDLYINGFVTPKDYRTVSFTLDATGVNTVQFVYNRGSIGVGSGNVGGEGTVWIDNIVGLDPFPGSPNTLTSLYGYMTASEIPASGQVYAYTSGLGPASGNPLAYMSGAANVPSGVTNAFLLSDTMESGMVYAYLPSVQASEQVYAFMEGSIDVAMDAVGAYIFTSGVEGSVLGYMKSAATGYIYGYLKAPSGAFDSVYAYTLTPEFTNVYGYLKGPIPHSGVAYGYLEGIDYDNHIYGYMHASGLNTSSYGYINAEGITGNIYAYMPNGEKINVAGYIKGADVASGVINAWTSGVGIESGVTYAYIPGISGVATGVFYGYMSAVNLPSGQVYGHLIGFDDGAGCNFPVPLPSSVAVPTGNFFT